MTKIEINKFKANFDKELILLCESGSIRGKCHQSIEFTTTKR
jgi:hypothetical protein